jgi:hypothetical protein
MTIDVNDIYELWDLELPAIPERSTLFHLKPIGVGTPDVESLTSYVKRLAIAHNVSPRMLILSEIAPLLDTGYVLGRHNKSLEKIYGQRTHALNGTGKMAESLVKALALRTLCSGLHFLTMLTWRDVISQKHLIRRHQAWCPFCYQEWHQNNQTLYEPLYWSFTAINICFKHHQRLIDRCPHCLEQFPPLSGQTRPGYCQKCVGCLGDIPKNQAIVNLNLSIEELPWQTFVANNIVELIIFAPSLKSSPSPEGIKQNIVACINNIFWANLRKFARLVDLLSSLLNSLINNNQSHELNNILKITYNLEISLLDFFLKSPGTILANLPIRNSAQSNNYRKQQRKKQNFKHSDLDKAQHILSEALKELPPPSINEIAKRIGCHCSTIRSNFPDLSAEIITKYHHYKKKDLQEKLEAALNEEPPRPLLNIYQSLGYKSSDRLYSLFPKICYQISKRYKAEIIKFKYQEVRNAAFKVHESGQEPNSSNIQVLLSKPSILMTSYAQE